MFSSKIIIFTIYYIIGNYNYIFLKKYLFGLTLNSRLRTKSGIILYINFVDHYPVTLLSLKFYQNTKKK